MTSKSRQHWWCISWKRMIQRWRHWNMSILSSKYQAFSDPRKHDPERRKYYSSPNQHFFGKFKNLGAYSCNAPCPPNKNSGVHAEQSCRWPPRDEQILSLLICISYLVINTNLPSRKPRSQKLVLAILNHVAQKAKKKKKRKKKKKKHTNYKTAFKKRILIYFSPWASADNESNFLLEPHIITHTEPQLLLWEWLSTSSCTGVCQNFWL